MDTHQFLSLLSSAIPMKRERIVTKVAERLRVATIEIENSSRGLSSSTVEEEKVRANFVRISNSARFFFVRRGWQLAVQHLHGVGMFGNTRRPGRWSQYLFGSAI